MKKAEQKYEKLFETYLNYLLNGDRNGCSAIVRDMKESGVSVFYIYEKFFKKSLYSVGELWEKNQISVAVEHMATLITEGLMNELFPDIISYDRKNRKAVVASIENEEHQVGGKMVADIFEKNGWDVFYLGGNTPVQELIRYFEENNPDIVALSLSVYTNMEILIKEIKALRKITCNTILIGGQALQNTGNEVAEPFTNVIYISDLIDLDEFINNLDNQS